MTYKCIKVTYKFFKEKRIMAFTPFEEKIMMYIGRQSVSISEIEKNFFGSSRPARSTLYRALQKLVHKSVIKMTGERRSARYEKVK